jgi:hypothetical protein
MVLQTSFPGPSGVADATMIRKDLAGLVLRDTSGNCRAGILPRTTSSLASVVAGTWTLSMAAFEAVLVRGGGPLFIENDGALVTPANTSQAPGANSRVDILYVKQNESASPYVDANNTPIMGWVYGTPGASPVKNSAGLAAIAGALELLTVQIPSTATSLSSAGVTVTETYPMTALSGESFWVRTATDLTALTAFVAGKQRAVALDTGITYRWNGTAWVPWEASQIAFTPTLTNVTLGTGGTNTATYDIVNGRYFVRGQIVLGTSGLFGGAVTIAPPVNMSVLVSPNQTIFGLGKVIDTGNAAYSLSLELSSTSAIALQVLLATGTYVFPAPVNATVPFTAGATDRIVYEYSFIPA